MATSVFPEHPEDLLLARPRRAPFDELALGCKTIAGIVQRAEWVLLAAAAPTLLFPGRATALGIGLIGTTWMARRMATGRWSSSTRVDRFVPLFGLALLVSLIPSVRLDYSAPKFWGVVLGLAVMYAVANTCRTARHLRVAELGLLLVGALLSGVGVVGMAAPPDKLIDDRGIYAALPHLVSSVQSSTVVTQGVHPNELAGTLILLIPLAIVKARQRGYVRWPALALASVMIAVVVLSQSRAALLGVLVAACVGAVWAAGRRGLVAVFVLLIVGIQTLIAVDGADHLRQRVLGDAPTAGVESLSGRVELWQRGLVLAVDMPLTGIGLNTYPVILQAYYPTILHSPATVVPHVHDLYLQTLLDFGMPGFFAWLAIIGTAVAAGVRAVRARVHAALVAGLLLGLLAHGVYSLVDAVTLGAKPGVLVWVILGVLLVVGAQAELAKHSRPTRARSAWTARLRSRWALLAAAIVLSPLLAAAVSLNAARIAVHQRVGTTSPLLEADLQLAQAFAPGPLLARVYAARALLAQQRGDTSAELESLDRATAIGGAWDSSLNLRLGDLRLAYGDRPRAIAAWRAADALPTLLDRAAASSPEQALDWYSLAQSVDPTDWRPYAGAARVLESSDPNRAAGFLSQAFQLRGADPARAALARRLVDP